MISNFSLVQRKHFFVLGLYSFALQMTSNLTFGWSPFSLNDQKCSESWQSVLFSTLLNACLWRPYLNLKLFDEPM